VLDDPPLLVDPPDDDVDEDDELDVSSFPPQATIAVAPAKTNAARVMTGARATAVGVNAGRSVSQNGHAASLTRTWRPHDGHGRRLAT
jgi:hypothetical protein